MLQWQATIYSYKLNFKSNPWSRKVKWGQQVWIVQIG